jgi:hypothetical protein
MQTKALVISTVSPIAKFEPEELNSIVKELAVFDSISAEKLPPVTSMTE